MMRGPRGPRGGAKPQNLKATVARLMGYVGRYRLRLVLVLFCILGNTIASVTASTFIKTLIDDYITPMIGQINPDFSGLLTQLVYMACIYGVGMVCGYLYNRLMVVVAQGVLKNVRDDMFAHMQTLPIRYFDTHSHGEIMSHYTNDTDTLRQMIAQALPQVFSSIISIVAVFVAMLSQSLWLTLTVVLFTVVQATSSILQGVRKQRIPMYTLVAGVVCKIALNYTLVGIPGFNIHGAPISSLVCYTVSLVPNLYYVMKYTGTKFNWRDWLVRPGIATLAMGAAVCLMTRILPFSRLLTIVEVAVGVAVFVVTAIWTKALTKEDLNAFRRKRK